MQIPAWSLGGDLAQNVRICHERFTRLDNHQPRSEIKSLLSILRHSSLPRSAWVTNPQRQCMTKQGVISVSVDFPPRPRVPRLGGVYCSSLRRYRIPHDYRCGLRVANCHPLKICRLSAVSIPAVSLSFFQIHGRPHGYARSAKTSKIHPLRIGLAKRMYFYPALASNSSPVIGWFGFSCVYHASSRWVLGSSWWLAARSSRGIRRAATMAFAPHPTKRFSHAIQPPFPIVHSLCPCYW